MPRRFLLSMALIHSALTIATAEDRNPVNPPPIDPLSVRRVSPLAIYDADPQHIWNRLFSALYVRPREIPENDGTTSVRFEGGDVIDFYAWGQSEYWSSRDTIDYLCDLLDAFTRNEARRQIDDPLRRAVMIRDLWAVYDFLTGQNIRRTGPVETRNRRHALARRLAGIMADLALEPSEAAHLPDTYEAAVQSGEFSQSFGGGYLPHGLLTGENGWVEIDFYQPDLHEDLADRFVTLHTRMYRGRSYFRIFYRFPGGRPQLEAYLAQLRKQGVDWKQAAQNGFILLKPDAPQIPVGTEVALVQFMMTFDSSIKPTPTKIIESIRHRTYLNVDGSTTPVTNTGHGMHVMEYTLKRRLLFDNLRRSGLHKEPVDEPQHLVIFQPPDARDWGNRPDQVLFQQCVNCHMTPRATRVGVHSMPSIVNMGGFDPGAQLGIATTLPAGNDVRARRAARWKSRHETWRRLMDDLGL